MKVLATVVLCLLVSSPAVAVECPAAEGAADTSGSAAARLASLAATLDDEARAAQRWTVVWAGTYAVATLAQLAVLGVVSKADRPDWYWGALSTVVGVAFSLLGPLEVLDAGRPFAERARHVQPDQVCQLIAEGERMVRDGAANEVGNRSWLLHVGNVLFNAGIGLVLGLGYGRWVSGLVSALLGVAMGEGTIFTAPNRLPGAWEHVRRGPPPPTISMRGLGVAVDF